MSRRIDWIELSSPCYSACPYLHAHMISKTILKCFYYLTAFFCFALFAVSKPIHVARYYCVKHADCRLSNHEYSRILVLLFLIMPCCTLHYFLTLYLNYIVCSQNIIMPIVLVWMPAVIHVHTIHVQCRHVWHILQVSWCLGAFKRTSPLHIISLKHFLFTPLSMDTLALYFAVLSIELHVFNNIRLEQGCWHYGV